MLAFIIVGIICNAADGRIWRVTSRSPGDNDERIAVSCLLERSDGNWMESSSCGKTSSAGLQYDSVDDVIDRLMDDGDVLEIDGLSSLEHVYRVCYWTQWSSMTRSSQSILSTAKSVSLKGVNGRPLLSCVAFDDEEMTSLPLPVVNGNETATEPPRSAATKPCSVTWDSVAWLDTDLLLADCDVTIKNSLFLRSNVLSRPFCNYISVTIGQSVFTNANDEVDYVVTRMSCGHCNNSYLDNDGQYGEQDSFGKQLRDVELVLTCSAFVRLNVINSHMKQATLYIQSDNETNVTVASSQFTANEAVTSSLAGLRIKLGNGMSDVVITDCLFQGRKYLSLADQAINMFEAALWITAPSPVDDTYANLQQHQRQRQTKLTITGCQFKNNERALTLIGTFDSIEIDSSEFSGQQSVHAGSGLLLQLVNAEHSSTNVAVLRNCSFFNNSAGHVVGSNYDVDSAYNNVTGEIELRTSRFKGAVRPVGKGGAIRVMTGNVSIIDSVFVNNSASSLGGSVFVDVKSSLVASKVRFETSQPTEETVEELQPVSLQGDIIYSDGVLTLDDVTLVAYRSMDGVSVLRHSGPARWSLSLTTIRINCSTGHDLRLTNSTSYGVARDGLISFYELDQLSYFCESCPRHYYSLDAGWFEYSRPNHASTTNRTGPSNPLDKGYYTLLVNYSSPSPELSGRKMHHKIHCAECPFGGYCVRGALKSLPNYWGYIVSSNRSSEVVADAVVFQRCPPGYCCQVDMDSHCRTYNSCAPHRTGHLCGTCNDGFTEATHSPTCLPDHTCRPALHVVMLFLLLAAVHTALLAIASLVPVRNQRKLRFDDVMLTQDDEVSSDNRKQSDRFHQREMENSTIALLLLLAFYYQDVQMLMSPQSKHTNHLQDDLFSQIGRYTDWFFSALFDFNTNILNISGSWCVQSLYVQAVGNVAIRTAAAPGILILLFLSYLVLLATARSRVTRVDGNMPRSYEAVSGASVNDVIILNVDGKSYVGLQHLRLLVGSFVLWLFVTQRQLVAGALQLVHCVQVDRNGILFAGDNNILFIDGSIKCYREWQLVVILYMVICLLPLTVVLMFEPTRLAKATISTRQFIAACMLPLPCLVARLIKWFLDIGNWKQQQPQHDKKSTLRNSMHQAANGHTAGGAVEPAAGSIVEDILIKPYRDDMIVCWAGVQLLLRQLIAVIYVTVADDVVRQVALSAVCFTSLVLHVERRPYKESLCNAVGSALLAGLNAVATTGLVRAAFTAAGYRPVGPNALLEQIFTVLDTVAIRFLPAFGLLALLLRHLVILKLQPATRTAGDR